MATDESAEIPTAEAGFRGVIALDGPSGTGKSTVARRLASRLGLRYLDTGAMYRAATVAVLEADIDPSDGAAVLEVVRGHRIEIGTNPAASLTQLDGRDVSTRIRDADTTRAVSAVSAVPEVRTILVDQQRDLIGAGAVVAEGRDIASVVWPDAELKVYLTARPEVRAERRAGELGAQDDSARAAVAADIRRRDDFDSSRAASPLRRADGAIEVDTSDLDIDGVVDRLIELLNTAAAGAHA